MDFVFDTYVEGNTEDGFIITFEDASGNFEQVEAGTVEELVEALAELTTVVGDVEDDSEETEEESE